MKRCPTLTFCCSIHPLFFVRYSKNIHRLRPHSVLMPLIAHFSHNHAAGSIWYISSYTTVPCTSPLVVNSSRSGRLMCLHHSAPSVGLLCTRFSVFTERILLPALCGGAAAASLTRNNYTGAVVMQKTREKNKCHHHHQHHYCAATRLRRSAAMSRHRQWQETESEKGNEGCKLQ